MQREDIIRKYFQSWLDKNVEPLSQIFSEDIVYRECYGPEYHGLSQILKWFADWNKNGTVLKWEIKKFIHQGTFTVVEWYFECNYENKLDGFDGVSIIEFNENMMIFNLKEFQSKAEHVFPYES